MLTCDSSSGTPDPTLRDRREVGPPVHVVRAPTEEWVNRRKADDTMPTDPEATVRAWNDAILRHDINNCLTLMSDDYKRYGDPSWDFP